MSDAPQPTTCALLAAGEGKRFSGPVHKLMAPLGGSTVLATSLTAMVAAGAGDCVVITGAETSARFLGEIGDVRSVHNPDWSSGQRSSVLLAIAVARAAGSTQVIIGLADQPFAGADAWRAVGECDAPIAVASYGGRRGNPVKLRSDVWELLENGPGGADEGARALMDRHPELVRQVACQGSPDDIDTHEDLTRWT